MCIRDRAWVGEPWAVVVYVLILTVALLVIHEEQAAAWVLWTLGIGNVLGIITKKTLKRERPGAHLEHDDGYSFPSGHVLGGTTLYPVSYTHLLVPGMAKRTLASWFW